jgi:hypothetical protein
LGLAWTPPAAQAAIWPFSLFGKKAPVKRPKPKRPRPGTGPAPGYNR